MSKFLGNNDEPEAEAREASPFLLPSIPMAMVSMPERMGAELPEAELPEVIIFPLMLG